MASARQWTDILSDLYGPVRFERLSRPAMEERHIDIALWKLRLCRTEIGPHRVALPHSLARPGAHPFNHVRFQTSGTAFFEQDGQTVTIAPGDCLVYNLSRPHLLWSPEPTSHDAVIFPIELVRLQSVPVELLWMRKIRRQDMDDVGKLARRMVQTIIEDAPTLPQSPAASVAQALLSLLNTFFSRDIVGEEGFSRSAMTRWRAKAFIEDHLRESDLDVGRVADAVGCSTRYLHALFQAEGTSAARHIWLSRLERCREEIESPVGAAKSITDVAFSWGFSSASHFTRSFRRHFGLPPSAARARSHRANPADQSGTK